MKNHLQLLFKKYSISIVCFGFLISLLLDQSFVFEIREDEHSLLRMLASFITDLALGIYWIGGAVILILMISIYNKTRFGRSKKDCVKNLEIWSYHLLLSLVTTGLFVIICKFVIGRERPHFSESAFLNFHPFSLEAVYQSFPSGHTQVIFCVATMFCYLFPQRRFLFMLIAFLIAISRALTLNHFISDVYAGAIVGSLGCTFTVNLFSHSLRKPRPFLNNAKKLLRHEPARWQG
jgi:membrane-associated phospholipid phosphatase